MAEYKYEPTKWNEMAGPIQGGRDTYQIKSWNPTNKKWGPWTTDGPAKVWFSEANATNWTESMICKTKDLFYEAKLNECFEKGDEVAIKIHYGEYNRTAILRPEYIAAIVEEVKACGGHPYVVNDTTLSYHTYNSMAISQYQMEGAIRHGYTDATFGCPVLIADGYSGEDDYRVDLPEGLILKETYIGRAIAEADAMIVLAHARGHSITMYGGVLKQLGIGCQSKRGKYITHLAHWGDPHDAIGWPKFTDKCPGKACKFHQMCDDSCPRNAHHVGEHGKVWYPERCRLCYSCQVTCIFSGMTGITFEENYFPNAMIAHADAALGALKCFDEGQGGLHQLRHRRGARMRLLPLGRLGRLSGCGHPGQQGHGGLGNGYPGSHRQGAHQPRFGGRRKRAQAGRRQVPGHQRLQPPYLHVGRGKDRLRHWKI